MFFDTHAHYDDKGFDQDREQVLRKAYDKGVEFILSASTDIASTIDNISLSQKYDFVYTAAGIHPHNLADINDQAVSALSVFATYPKVVAIGEIGLDYYYDNVPRDIQKDWFARQLSLAGSLKKPVIIHDRDAHEDTMDIVKAENARDVGGVFHCYSGSVEMAREVLNHNFYISFAGAITFKNAKKALDVIKYVPDDRILI
jgi:TatD DNase family protein